MTNKKSIMAVSALWILIFHLWVFVSNGNTIEMFIKSLGYVGVDMFFFVSAYSLGKREVTKYGQFLWSRFQAVYLKFILFAIVACIYANWSIERLLKVIVGYEFIKKGGGAFLWFLPAIMIYYIIVPLYQRIDKKYPLFTAIITLGVWFGVGFILYKPLMIFWNRIPVLMLGYYMARADIWGKCFDKAWVRLVVGVILTVIGCLLANQFAYKHRLQTPFTDMFYVTVIILALGLVLLASMIPECFIVRWIGSATLEIYAIQMIFGYKLMNRIIKLTKNKWLINISTLIIVVAIAVVVHYGYRFVVTKLKGEKKTLT